jgi:arylsulfatase
LQHDPQELEDLAGSPRVAEVQQRLTEQLIGEFYGGDLAWVKDGALVGLPDQVYTPKPDRGLSGQRGIHWPPPPLELSGKPVGAPG